MHKFMIFILILIPLNTFADTLLFNKKSVNFGTILQNTKVYWETEYTNKSKNSITIDKVKATCGCTIPELTKKELAPGDSGKIKIEFNSGSFKGHQMKYVFVDTNEGERIILTIEANIVQKFSLAPSFLEFNEGEGQEWQTVNLTKNSPDTTIEILNIETKSPALECKLLSPSSFKVKIIDYSKCKELENIHIFFNNNKSEYYDIKIKNKSDYLFDPEKVVLLNLESGKKRIKKIKLKHKDNKTLKINNITSEIDWLNTSFKNTSDNEVEIKIIVDSEKLGKGFGQSTIKIDLTEEKNSKVLELPVIFSIKK